jgi:hypothetical protein
MKKLTVEPLDLLRKLGDQYRHVEQEHQRRATRRRIATEMHDIR